MTVFNLLIVEPFSDFKHSDLDLVVTGITSDENELDALYALAEELRNRNIPAGTY